MQKHIHIRNGGGTYEAIVVGSGRIYKQPPYYAYRFYSQFFGKKIVEAVSNQPETVSSYGSLDKDGNLRIILINKSGAGFKAGGAPSVSAGTLKVRISIPQSLFIAGSQGESYKMTARFTDGPLLPINSLDDENFYEKQTGVPTGNIFDYDVPAYSAVILKVPRETGGGGGGGENGNGSTANFCLSGAPSKANGNANCDGRIDIRDFFIWRREFLKKGTLTADFDGNGKVDIRDFFRWRRGLSLQGETLQDPCGISIGSAGSLPAEIILLKEVCRLNQFLYFL